MLIANPNYCMREPISEKKKKKKGQMNQTCVGDRHGAALVVAHSVHPDADARVEHNYEYHVHPLEIAHQLPQNRAVDPSEAETDGDDKSKVKRQFHDRYKLAGSQMLGPKRILRGDDWHTN
jgi:hypothetical protein